MTPKDQADIVKNNLEKIVRANDGRNLKKVSDHGSVRLSKMRVADMNNISSGHAANKLIIDSHLFIMLVGDNPDIIEEQLRKLNVLYGDNMNGIKIDSVAGAQEELLRKLLSPPSGTGFDEAWLSSDFAGNDHAVRKGLDDYDGAVAIGELTNSFASGVANMSLYKTFEKRVLVAAYPESFINGYDEELSASSMWGQKIANNVMVHDKRVFHIVMNGFKYYGGKQPGEQKQKFANSEKINSELEYVDLSKGGLNPLEMFGDLEDVVQIYNTNQVKLVEMFYLMAGRNLDASQRIALRTALNDFYKGQKLWTDDAAENPRKTRVLGITEHETFPVMGMFIGTLTNGIEYAKRNGTQKDVDNATLLHATLKNALETNRSIFNKTTTLPDPKELKKSQIYYDLSKLRNTPDILEAQFLNAFDYIAHAAGRDDVIMIHGMDKLSVGTLKAIQTRLNYVSEKGVKFAYLFDTIGGGVGSQERTNMSEEARLALRANVFNTDGLLYQNIDQQFGYTIFGTMSIDDLAMYESKVKQKLTKNLKETLTASNEVMQYQIRRPADLTTVFVQGDFLV